MIGESPDPARSCNVEGVSDQNHPKWLVETRAKGTAVGDHTITGWIPQQRDAVRARLDYASSPLQPEPYALVERGWLFADCA